jgi:hypothetical protein
VPDLISRWVEGAETGTQDFRKRVRLSSGFYLALCEAALNEVPELGAALWRSLRKMHGISWIGAAGIDELTHIPFRVRRSSESELLLDEMLNRSVANTDQELFELAIAAELNGRNDWLDQRIQQDRTSVQTWQQRRGDVFEGFRSGNALPIEAAWPAGPTIGGQHRLVRSAQWQLAEASAAHWWKSFVAASDAETALASWTLFLGYADRRSLRAIKAWMPERVSADKLERLKRFHVVFNHGALMRAVEKREKPLADNFLGERTVRGIAPWL